ncbi:MAG: serine hydrolase domain-containing protein [Microcella sp.]|uniref:serine hydrolase domain-containing protein n=1 Tax=Microcella sp. TaxID=1913979 RepID=UPI003314A19E
MSGASAEPRWSAASAWVQRHVDAGHFPAAVLGITDASGTRHLEAFGSVDGRPTSSDERFALYSITKPLVALTALRAVEAGQLTVDARLRDALPRFLSPEVTLAHLMSHSSGIVDAPLGTPLPPGAASLHDVIEHTGLETIVGTARRYNNLAWAGVSAILESATGAPLAEQLARLTRAVGADGLSFETAGIPPVHGGDVMGHDPEAMFAQHHPAAGLAARATDLLAIGRSLLARDGAVVAPPTLAAMQRPRTEGLFIIDPEPRKRFEHFGLGWNLPRRPGLVDHSVFGHEGWTMTQFWVSPASGLCLVLLTNRLDAREPWNPVRPDELQNAVFAPGAR